MRYSEKIGVRIDMINKVLGVFGLALIVGWTDAHVSFDEQTRAIHNVEIEGVHVHPALCRPSWWPE